VNRAIENITKNLKTNGFPTNHHEPSSNQPKSNSQLPNVNEKMSPSEKFCEKNVTERIKRVLQQVRVVVAVKLVCPLP